MDNGTFRFGTEDLRNEKMSVHELLRFPSIKRNLKSEFQ